MRRSFLEMRMSMWAVLRSRNEAMARCSGMGGNKSERFLIDPRFILSRVVPVESNSALYLTCEELIEYTRKGICVSSSFGLNFTQSATITYLEYTLLTQLARATGSAILAITICPGKIT